MSGAIFRVRKRVQALHDDRDRYIFDGELERACFATVLSIIDEEIERDAEKAFTQPINPDPLTVFFTRGEKQP